MNNSLSPPEPDKTGGPTVWHMVVFTAVVSALTSLLIVFMNLIKRSDLASPRQAEGMLAINSSQAAQPGEGAAILTEGHSMTTTEKRQAVNLPIETSGKPVGADKTSHTPAASLVLAQYESDLDASARLGASTRWNQTTKYIVGVGLFLTILFVIFISRSVLGMITFAALLAFILQPLVRLLQRKFKLRKGTSIGLSYLLVVVALIMFVIVAIPAIVNAFNDLLSNDWTSIGQNIVHSLETAALNVSSVPVIGPVIASALVALAQMVSGAVSLGTPPPIVIDVSTANAGKQLAESLGKLAGFLGPLISAGISLVFMLLISLRMSLSADDMGKAYPKLMPAAYREEVTDLVQRILNVWSSFLSGELTLMVFMGVMTYLLNLVLGTPYPLFLGVIAGLLEVIPNIGPVLATIPAIILALMFGSSHLAVSNLAFAIIVGLGYMMLSALENQVVVPKLLGDAVNLPPLVVIIGCTIGGAVFGLLGVLLSTPIISTGKEIFGYLYNKILEPPPLTGPPEEKPSMMDKIKGITRSIHLPFRRREQTPAAKQGKLEVDG